MEQQRFHAWLRRQNYDPRTIGSRISNVQRIEEFYGDLDEHFDNDRLSSLISFMSYSKDDQRYGHPNRSKIPIDGDIYNGLATLRSAVNLYGEFRLTRDGSEEADPRTRTASVSEEPLLN